jgi:hypothetical protein
MNIEDYEGFDNEDESLDDLPEDATDDESPSRHLTCVVVL